MPRKIVDTFNVDGEDYNIEPVMDAVPTQGSPNAVESGGVYSELIATRGATAVETGRNVNGAFTRKGAFDYTLGSISAQSWLGKVFGHLFGRVWTQGTGANATFSMNKLTYANGLWVCGSTYHGMWWSEDGKSWTQGTGDNTYYEMEYLVYANGLWVCGSYNHGLWWSEDGKSWTQGTGGNTYYEMEYLVYANGLWVCGSDSHGLWWSEDGKSWTQVKGITATYAMQYIVYANGMWACVSNSRGCWWSGLDQLIADGYFKD